MNYFLYEEKRLYIWPWKNSKRTYPLTRTLSGLWNSLENFLLSTFCCCCLKIMLFVVNGPLSGCCLDRHSTWPSAWTLNEICSEKELYILIFGGLIQLKLWYSTRIFIDPGMILSYSTSDNQKVLLVHLIKLLYFKINMCDD